MFLLFTAGFSVNPANMKNEMPWKIFIFKTPQAYHWKLLIEICPNLVQSIDWTIPPEVEKSKIFKKKNIFWLPKPKMRRALKRSKMSFSSKSDFYRPRHLIFNKSININFWLKKIPRKRIIAGTRPIIIKKVTNIVLVVVDLAI